MSVVGDDGKKRCFGGRIADDVYARYHDDEWGIPVYDDQHLFEMLILEGAQAGLSWNVILKKRSAYRKAFYHFNVEKVARMSNETLDRLCCNTCIVRNKMKIYSARNNARLFIDIQKEYDNFSNYIWSFVNFRPIKNHWQLAHEIPVDTEQSMALSVDLKRRGMRFTGKIIMYAYMQAVGMVNDHLTTCWCYHR